MPYIIQRLVRKMCKKVDVVFSLKSPLHIGYMPFKGSVVSPTRYYVPGRNLWGALTKRITEFLNEKPEAEEYKEIGKRVREIFRFSYLYLYHEKTVYFPRYTHAGLIFGDNKKYLTKSEFEHKFIGSIVSTEIDRVKKTAMNEKLHEIEFIHNMSKDENGEIRPVKLLGRIWVKEGKETEDKKISLENTGIFIDDFNIIQELILGGESKYGFGHVSLDSVNKAKFPESFLSKLEDEKDKEIENNKPIPAHLKYSEHIKFYGNVELLSGRGYYDPKNDSKESNSSPGMIISKPEYYLSPGTVIEEEIRCKLNWDGTLEIKRN